MHNKNEKCKIMIQKEKKIKKNKFLRCIYVPPLWFSLLTWLSYLLIIGGILFIIILIVKRKRERSKLFTKYSKIIVIIIILSIIWLAIAGSIERKLSERYYESNPVPTWKTESIFSGGCR